MSITNFLKTIWSKIRYQESIETGCGYTDKPIHQHGLKMSENDSEGYDTCVICGKKTPYLFGTHVNLREGYIDGSGQGCYQPDICKKKSDFLIKILYL